ncbi:hypothetical protein MWH03_00260 [Klebsiella pneumoniae]|nr:hypothetical protein [Klebsiella pneumoniae]
MTMKASDYPVQFMYGPVNHVEIPLSLVVEIPNVHRYIFPLKTRQRDNISLRLDMGMQILSHLRPRWEKHFPADTSHDEMCTYVARLITKAWKEKAQSLSWDADKSSLRGQNFGCGGYRSDYFVLLEGK